MSTLSDKYSVLYKLNIIINSHNVNIPISSSDVVSIMIVNNYDRSTYPIIRLRLYTDISNMQNIIEYPDDIMVSIIMNGNLYRMNDDNPDGSKSVTPIGSASNISFSLKGYVENKNIPTSVMDQYDQGIKKDDSLNVEVKVPIEIYCYNKELIHFMRKKTSAIYKDMTIPSVIDTIFRQQGVSNLLIDTMHNQTRYSQILIPNLDINETLSFFDSSYGMYHKGTQVYGDIDKMYICNSDAYNGTTPLPIFVESYKSNSDMGGMRKSGSIYQMNTKANNVSVISETDIERVLNSENINSINVNDLDVQTTSMVKLFPDVEKLNSERISINNSQGMTFKTTANIFATPDILHKSKNKYITEMYNARISERITKVDISGVGFDIGKMKINTRYNLIFDSPIRGMSINEYYRATNTVHVISNMDSNLFIAQTTMNLCSN